MKYLTILKKIITKNCLIFYIIFFSAISYHIASYFWILKNSNQFLYDNLINEKDLKVLKINIMISFFITSIMTILFHLFIRNRKE